MRSLLRPLLVAALLLSLLPVAACRVRNKTVKGYGVKGPLAHATVRAYEVDPNAPDLKGALLDTGATNAAARTQGLAIPPSTTGPIVLEFVATPATVDLSTGAAPVIQTLCTIVDAQRAKNGEVLFATPLTTLAVNLASETADVDGNGSVTLAEVNTALAGAATVVTSTVGFGLLADVDIFTTPPMLTAGTSTPETQDAVARYRMASEALAAVVVDLLDDATTDEADAVLQGLAEDLSDDVIDGQVDGAPVAAFAGIADPVAVVTQDPATLMIPGTTTPVTEIETVLAAETAQTGVGSATEELTDGTIDPAPSVPSPLPDTDGDGVANVADTCPTLSNPSQQPALWGSFAWGTDCWQ